MNARPHHTLTALAIVGFYVHLDIPVGAGLLPNVIGCAIGLALLGLHLRRVNPVVLLWLGGLGLFYLTMGLWAADIGRSDAPLLQPTAQLLYTTLTAYGVYLDLTLWKRGDINRLFGALAGCILVGAALEVYTPLRGLIQVVGQMHNLARPMQADLALSLRDIGMYGQVRPRLFTAETSFVGTNFGLFAALWLLSAERITRRTVTIAAGMILGALVVIRSPFVILPVLTSTAEVLFNRERALARAKFTGLEFVLFVIAALLVFSVSGVLFAQIFGSRLARAQTGNDWSITVRTYGAIVAGWRTALEYPFLGTGPGNFDAIRPIQLRTYADMHVPEYALTPGALRMTLNNGIAASLAFFGLVGSIVYFVLLTGFCRALRPQTPTLFIWATILITYITAGSIYSPKAVWPIFLILAVAGASVAARAPKAATTHGLAMARPAAR